MACRRCNEFKGIQTEGIDSETNLQVPLFNPRTQEWAQPFQWTDNGLFIIGSIPAGRATVETLRMNNEFNIRSRKRWICVGWHPPS